MPGGQAKNYRKNFQKNMKNIKCVKGQKKKLRNTNEDRHKDDFFLNKVDGMN